MQLLGTYAGIVENVKDPQRLGRVKARVPHVHGVSGSGAGYIGTNDLPWALPSGMPAGGGPASGGFSQLPAVGDKVWVRFLDGEPEKPVWEWGMQSLTDRDNMKLHSYDETAGKVGNPKSTIWTRYGHAFEINAGSIIVTTSKGYRLQIIDGDPTDGTIRLTTALGNQFQLDDLDDGAFLHANVDFRLDISNELRGTSDSFTWRTMSSDFSVRSGGAIDMTSVDDITLTTTSNFSVDALTAVDISASTNMTLTAGAQMQLEFTTLNLGTGASEPYVLGNQLTLFLDSLLLYLSTHTHGNGNMGSPTTPPIVPPLGVVQPVTALLTSKVILGQ